MSNVILERLELLEKILTAFANVGKRPHHFANEVLRQTDQEIPPFDLDPVLKFLKLTIHSANKDRIWTSALDGQKIWYHSNTIHHQRFVIAHQIGHYLMHPKQLYRCQTYNGNDYEKEANDFAASLLAPLWVVEPICAYNPITMDQLSKMMNVSKALLNYQIDKLLF